MKKRIFGKNKNKKAGAKGMRKPLAFLLAGVLLLAMLPFTAMADEPAEQIEKLGNDPIYYKWNDTSKTFVKDDTNPLVSNNPSGGAPEVKVTKTIEGSASKKENEFDITLTVETDQRIESSVTAPTAAVVLVIDVSGSMGSNTDGMCAECGLAPNASVHTSGTGHAFVQRLLQAKAAAKAFLRQFAGFDAATGVYDDPLAARWVSIVTYSTSATATLILDWTDIHGTNEADTNSRLSPLNTTIDNMQPGGSTNTDAGMRMAFDQWSKGAIGSIDNRFTVLLTDGIPNQNAGDTLTAYGFSPKYIGVYGPSGYTSGGLPYNNPARSAYRLQTMAKPSMVYSIAFGLSSDVGTAWLAALSDQSVLANNSAQLLTAFNKIINFMKLAIDAWKVTDPMGSHMVLGSVGGTHTVSSVDTTANTLTWYLRQDLANANIKDKQTGQVVNVQYYNDHPEKEYSIVYTLKYSVKLDTLGVPEADLRSGKYFNTNDQTTLQYYLTKDDNSGQTKYIDNNGNEMPSAALLSLDFKVPAVRGYGAELKFNKVDHNGNPLSGAEFTLVVDNNSTPYAVVTSAVNTGLVDFGYLPSGHTYTLRETAAPVVVGGPEYVIDGTVYNLAVNYGKLTGATGGMFSESGGVLTFKNYPTRYDVSITKETVNNLVDYKDGKAEYTIRITNNESVALNLTKITDAFDTGMLQYVKSFGAVSAKLDGADYNLGGAGFSGGTLEIGSAITLPAGKSLVITYTVFFEDYIVPGASSALSMREYTNNVEVMVEGFDPHDDSKTVRQHGRGYTVTKEIYTISGLQVTSQYQAQPGDEIVYRVTVRNTSTSGADAIAVTKEMLKDNFTFSGDTSLDVAGPFVNGNTGSGWGLIPFTGESLTSGGSLTVYYTFTIPNDDSAYGQTLNNTAVFDPGDGPTPPGGTPEITVDGTKLVMDKVIVGGNKSPYASGDEIAFQVTVENVGNIPANNVRFSDVLSGGGSGIQAPEYKAIQITLDDETTVIPFSDWSAMQSYQFSVGAFKTVTLSYIVKVYGPEDITPSDVEALMEAVDEAEAAFQDMLGLLQAAYDDAADAYEQAVFALEDAYYALDDAVAAADPEDPEPADYTEYYDAIEEAQAEVDRLLGEMNDAAALLDDGYIEGTDEYIELMAALAAYNAAIEIVNDSSLVVEYSNAATVTGGGNWQSATTGFGVGLQHIKGLSVIKEVQVDGGGYGKIASIPYDGAEISYRITVKNDGNTDLADVKVYDEFNGAGAVLIDEIAVLQAGEAAVYYIDGAGNVTKDGALVATIAGYDVFTNGGTVRINAVSNSASVTVGGEDGPSSTTVVNISPKPTAKLDIIKYVRGSADPSSDAGWARGYTTYTNGTAKVDFKIVVRNYGNAAATVTLADYLNINGGGSADSFSKTITVEPGESNKVVETIYGVELGSGDWAVNTATLLPGDGDDGVDIVNGESVATAEIRPIPHSVMSVHKQVWDGESWVTSAVFQSPTAKEVTFRITVANEGEAAGTFMIEDIFDGVDITGELVVKINGEDVPAFSSAYYNASGGYFTVPGEGSVEFFYVASIYGQKGNAARIRIIGDDEETTGANDPYNTIDGGEDEASVIVASRPIISISKYVAQGAHNESNDTPGVVWSDRISLTTNPLTVTYKIVVQVDGMNPSEKITVNVGDSILTEAMPAFEFNTDGQQIYYYTRVYSAVGNYSNTAWIESIDTTDGDSDPEVSADTPTTNVTINPPPSQPYYPPSCPDTTPTIWNPREGYEAPTTPAAPATPLVQEETLELESPDVPLAALPEIIPVAPPADDNDDSEAEAFIELENPDVPLGNLPQTGLLTIYNLVFMMGVALIITGVVMMLRTRRINKSMH